MQALPQEEGYAGIVSNRLGLLFSKEK